jgi:meiosis-specific transcription factor NDT80
MSLGGGAPCPPLGNTEIHYTLQAADGSLIKPEIFGRIDKGFFQADGDWTCYRRNYFSLVCSYSLTPLTAGPMYLQQSHGARGPQVHSFAMSIAAVVDGRGGKSIDLVQHTPKRDKGPQDKPARIPLAPRPSTPPHGLYNDNLPGSCRSSLYDTQAFSQNPNQPETEATFERIQFKNATANNGKRRAAQQYYHLLVELFVDIGHHAPSAERWVKIASRMSAQMVVRGRSPGHYGSDRRGSNSSTGGPGPGGSGGGGGYTPTVNSSRTPGDLSMSGTSSMMGGSSYGSYDARQSHYRSLGLMDPTVSEEEAKVLATHGDYTYFPGAIYEEPSHALRGMSEYTTNKIKSESNLGGHGAYQLPSLATYDGFGRRCGPFEGTGESRGYFTMPTISHELNMT